MMANCSKTLLLLASKLGLTEKKKVMSKAAEYERRLQIKLNSTPNSSISDTAKVVICLDLATAYCGEEFDLRSAHRLSGIKANQYANNKHFVENLLDILSERLTAAALCVTLECHAVKDLAEEILQEYRDKNGFIDLKLPQYVCMAVYQACRLKKVKVSKSKLIEKSRLKPGQFTKLEAEWTKFTNEQFPNYNTKKETTTSSKVAPQQNVLVENNMEVENSPKGLRTSCKTSTLDETYFEWKKRILTNAYREIANAKKEGLLDDQEKAPPSAELKRSEKKRPVSPKKLKEFQYEPVLVLRKSPRKTPHKFDSYKSPAGGSRGVKLLFPLNE